MSCPDWHRLVALRDGAGDPRRTTPATGARTAARGTPAAHAADAADVAEASEAEWLSALEHLDSCARCGSAALAADPTLIFRRLGAGEITPAAESAEVESVRRVVAAMRTGHRLERAHPSGHWGHWGHWRRYAAAAVLALAALSLGVEDAGRTAAGRPALLAQGTGQFPAGAPAPDAADTIGSLAAPRRQAGSILPAAMAAMKDGGGPAFVAVPVSRGSLASVDAGAGPADGSADGAMEGLNRPKARVYQLHGKHLQVVMIVDEKLDV